MRQQVLGPARRAVLRDGASIGHVRPREVHRLAGWGGRHGRPATAEAKLVACGEQRRAPGDVHRQQQVLGLSLRHCGLGHGSIRCGTVESVLGCAAGDDIDERPLVAQAHVVDALVREARRAQTRARAAQALAQPRRAVAAGAGEEAPRGVRKFAVELRPAAPVREAAHLGECVTPAVRRGLCQQPGTGQRGIVRDPLAERHEGDALAVWV
mmetsp:Transcript_3850/g.12020  ORF Transcript_3850/g.12020 Transcript_3850/m.12020 type:complete len:211 (+) Transcript_3850:489-1121(+)